MPLAPPTLAVARSVWPSEELLVPSVVLLADHGASTTSTGLEPRTGLVTVAVSNRLPDLGLSLGGAVLLPSPMSTRVLPPRTTLATVAWELAPEPEALAEVVET